MEEYAVSFALAVGIKPAGEGGYPGRRSKVGSLGGEGGSWIECVGFIVSKHDLG